MVSLENAAYFLRCHYGKLLTVGFFLGLTVLAYFFLGVIGAMIGALVTAAVAKYCVTTA